MAKEVTVIAKDETRHVRLGILVESGRIYHHIRFIDGALVGGTEPTRWHTKIPKEDVELLDGHRFDVLSEYLDRTKIGLEWQAERQQAIAGIRASAEEKIEKQVAFAIKRWEREHPRPEAVSPRPSPEPDPVPVPVGEELSHDIRDSEGNRVDVTITDGRVTMEPLPEEQRTSTPGGNEFMDDNEAGDERVPAANGSFTGRWNVGDTVIVKENWDVGIVSKAEPEDGKYWVSVGGEYPQTFMANELEAPDPAQREA